MKRKKGTEVVVISTERLRKLAELQGIDPSDTSEGYLFQHGKLTVHVEPENEWRVRIDPVGMLDSIATLIVECGLGPVSVIPYILTETSSPWASAIVQLKLHLMIERRKEREVRK